MEEENRGSGQGVWSGEEGWLVGWGEKEEVFANQMNDCQVDGCELVVGLIMCV